MGKKKVRSGGAGKLPVKVKIQRGTIVVELTRTAAGLTDPDGREYETIETKNGLAYYLKHAHLSDSKVWLGICSNNKNHQFHTDNLPLKKDRKCGCGGEYVFTDLSSKDSTDVETSETKPTLTPQKKRSPNKRKPKAK